ncbi:MAG: hypothetical protein U0S50_01475 [Sphingopyxis sp.]|uniref:hypothetical protein n=1 Tax=Sphingopyxis sp. TaxID=1908224 RepID=UPI002AB97942|nr:hypothetical protein [Sphingopyxis sp.]MDZ3830471.1 hypothetical protein [Sphingopyxis sp.]
MSDTPDAPPAVNTAIPTRLLRYLPFLTAAHFLIGLPALIASLALAYFAFVQADATRKMQTGGVMPFVTFGTSNVGDKGEAHISLSLTNNGVGPAILGPVEIWYEGQNIAGPGELLNTCCDAGDANRLAFSTSPSTGIAVRPGEEVRFLGLPRTPENEAVWQAFNRERWKLKLRACYCSIYQDCWITEGMQAIPKPVAACPANWKRYSEDAARRLGG